ncbi:MAG TPA: Nif3-like dinuclear metal center hexameric protein [Clostridiales bacterium]|jgi:dinuclear metal center YbgI/SA1388 family protein|nr:Nif3-like dinuclear metal center hexameric protein [Clostridiales bacterium]
MINLEKIIEFMNIIAPPEQKEEGDNIGFLVGRINSEITKCVLCLDVTLEVIQESIELGAQLIISHHPLIYKPISSITDQTLQGKKILDVIKHNINIFSAHTNLDASEQGINDYIAGLLDLQNVQRFDTQDSAWQGGRIGEMKEPITLINLANKLITILQDNSIRLAGKRDKQVQKIAFISGGAGKTEYLRAAIDMGADCYISADFAHHTALEAYEKDFGLILCSHYCMERVILKRLRQFLSAQFKTVQFIISSKEKNPIDTI